MVGGRGVRGCVGLGGKVEGSRSFARYPCGGVRSESGRRFGGAARRQEVLARRQEVLARAAPPLENEQNEEVRVIPTSIHDIDNGKILGFDHNLSEDHPGFKDEDYKQRRSWIAGLARDILPGDEIPRLEYRPEEVETWAKALEELEQLFPTHACKEFLDAIDKLDFRPDVVPQLQDVHQVLQETSGFAIRPVAGLLHPRDFLNGLAFKTFHSTQYMRHWSQPHYTPEPDLIHEIIGHIPMLTNKYYADMVQQIGLASLYATDKEIWHLTKVYWYTVEFGVVMEDEEIKAFGAGVLSSYGELDHMRTGNPEFAPLDPWAKQPKMSYKDGFQKKYFVLNSFEEGSELLREYSQTFLDRKQ